MIAIHCDVSFIELFMLKIPHLENGIYISFLIIITEGRNYVNNLR